MSRSSRRTYRTSRRLQTLALVASLSISPGCAKLHNKLHKHKHAHDEIAYAPFPAKSGHGGFASVSPQMPTIVNSTVSKQEPFTYSDAVETAQPALVAPQEPARSVPRSSPFAADSTRPETSKPVDTKPASPKPVTITPEPVKPSQTAPAGEAPKADSTPASLPPAITPSASVPLPGGTAPANDPKLPVTPPGLPASDKLPIDLPVDLPPPPANPELSGSGSRGTSTVATNSAPAIANSPALASPFSLPRSEPLETKGEVLTLSLPGQAAEPAPDSPPTTTSATSAEPNPSSAPVSSAIEKSPEPTGGDRSEVTELAEILAKTRNTFANVTNYKVDVFLQERMNGRKLPEDRFTLYKRRQPLAVRMEWTEGKDVGREVIFSPAETNGMIQIRMPKGLIPRISMAPDSPLVRSKSRHPINEAGADSVVERLDATLRRFQSGSPDAGRLIVESAEDPQLGKMQRITHHTVDREIWVVDLSADSGLPLTIHATDETGELLEHYEFRGYQLNLPDLMTAESFDHNARWGNPKLFGRLASGISKDESPKR